MLLTVSTKRPCANVPSYESSAVLAPSLTSPPVLCTLPGTAASDKGLMCQIPSSELTAATWTLVLYECTYILYCTYDTLCSYGTVRYVVAFSRLMGLDIPPSPIQRRHMHAPQLVRVSFIMMRPWCRRGLLFSSSQSLLARSPSPLLGFFFTGRYKGGVVLAASTRRRPRV